MCMEALNEVCLYSVFFPFLFSCTFVFLFHWWGQLSIEIVTFALSLLLNILFVKMYISICFHDLNLSCLFFLYITSYSNWSKMYCRKQINLLNCFCLHVCHHKVNRLSIAHLFLSNLFLV